MKGIVVRQPVVSEKSVQLGSESKYTFLVDARANLPEIKSAVESLFKVKVKQVNLINVKGKPKSDRRVKVHRAGVKKAIVTLFPGQTIKLFEEKKTDAS